jgi:hypothetical protein
MSGGMIFIIIIFLQRSCIKCEGPGCSYCDGTEVTDFFLKKNKIERE